MGTASSPGGESKNPPGDDRLASKRPGLHRGRATRLADRCRSAWSSVDRAGLWLGGDRVDDGAMTHPCWTDLTEEAGVFRGCGAFH